MSKLSELTFKDLLELTIAKAHEAQKPNRTFKYLYSLAVNVDEGNTQLLNGRQKESLLEILSECLLDIDKSKEPGNNPL
ncbi:MAG: hypothetical protein JNM24_06790 [Bdellovibrionaceae bacterium]|nr:hypothetical protein [Pseudobdellovibrionaceae bacterium]